MRWVGALDICGNWVAGPVAVAVKLRPSQMYKPQQTWVFRVSCDDVVVSRAVVVSGLAGAGIAETSTLIPRRAARS